jgi:O-antigen/teichoic acid export membrane protein
MAVRASYRESLVFAALSSVAMIVLGLGSSIVIAREYGATVLGQFALVSAPTLAMAYLSSLQEQAALVRAVAVLEPRAPRVGALFYAVLAFSTALTIGVALLVLGVTYLLFHGPVGHPELFGAAVVSMAGFVVFTNTSWNIDMLLAAFRAGRQLFWVRLTQAVSYLAVAAGLGAVRPTLWALIGATIASWALSLGQRLVAARTYMPVRIPAPVLREGFGELPEMVRFGMKLAPGNVASGLSSQIGTWVLGAVAPIATVGAFNRAQMLGQRLIEVQTRISEVLFPTLVERRRRRDHAGFDRAVVDSLRYVSAALLLPAAAGGGAALGVMSLFGPGFGSAAGALTLLLLIPALASMSGIQGQVLIAGDRPLMSTTVSLTRMAVTLALTVPLTLWLGATGAALAFVLGYVLSVGWLQVLTRRSLSRPFRELWTGRQLVGLPVAYAGGFAAAWAVDHALPRPAGLPVSLACGSAAFAVVLVGVGGLSDRDRDRWDHLRDQARRRVRMLGRGRVAAMTEAP